MKIILLENIKALGKKGDVKEVAEGYARNFLLPKNLAEFATEESIKKVELKKEKDQASEEAKLKELKDLAEKLKKQSVVISTKEKDGKLFGSITAKKIAKELEKEGLKVSENSIILKEAIKKTGDFEIQIKLAENLETKIKLEIKGN